MSSSHTGKITLITVRQLAPGEEIRDTELKGFGVRRQTNIISYFVHTRIRGRLKRLTIGRHGSPWTPETARKEAARLLMQIRTGGDPALQRDERRQADQTFKQVADEFIRVHVSQLKPSTQAVYSILIRLQLIPAFKSKSINAITATDVHKAHSSWRDKPRTANHAVAVLSKLLTWAEQHGYRKPGDNPCSSIKRFKEKQRERYLTPDELKRLGQTLAKAEAGDTNPWVIGLVRMLILTGARRSEMTTLRWSYFDQSRGLLRLPDSKTGAKTIYLNQQAIDVLKGLPRIDKNPWVFPGHIHGTHLVNVQKPWRTLRTAAGLDDVRLHDLRHSFATISIDVGGTLPMIGYLLGHRQSQTTARYAHVAPHPAQQVADAAGARIEQAWADTKES